MTTPENLKMNEAVQDTNSPEKKGDDVSGVEIVKNSENTDAVKSLQQLESTLSHNTSTTAEQMLQTEKTLELVKVNLFGEEMTIEEMKDIPDLEVNMKIWKKLEAGNYSHSQNLTYITPRIAELLSKYQGNLLLNGLTFISDIDAEHLSKHEGYYLSLGGLTFLSDNAAEHLSKYNGYLGLGGLTSISDTVAKHLSKHLGHLCLTNLHSISDTAARFLSERKGPLSIPANVLQKIDSFKKPQS